MWMGVCMLCCLIESTKFRYPQGHRAPCSSLWGRESAVGVVKDPHFALDAER